MLMAALKQDRSVTGRVRAAKALLSEGSPAAITALEDALKGDPFWGVRCEVADLLATRGGEAAGRALLGALTDPHPKVRRAVVSALSKVRRPEVAEALKALPADPSLQVEGEVVRALGRLRDDATASRAENLLAQGSWMEVLRCRALEGLGLTRDPSVLPTLLTWTGTDKPTRARATAAAALARLGDEVETARKPALERLIELAEDPEYRVQVASINALGVLKETGALWVLDRVHSSGGDGRCRRLAYEAMANIRDGRTTEQGLSILKKDLEDIKAESQKLRDSLSKIEQRTK
jgi:aminopeptidase N